MAPRRAQPRGLVARVFVGPWTEAYIPELGLARTEFERIEAAARQKSARAGTGREIVATVIFVATQAAIAISFPIFRPPWMPGWIMILLVLPVTLCFIVLMASMSRESARRAVRRYLLSRGVALCQSCGYDLRGLVLQPPASDSTPRCPECGTAVDPKVRALLEQLSPGVPRVVEGPGSIGP